MGKLVQLIYRVPQVYQPAQWSALVSELERAINALGEDRIEAHYSAMSAAPTSANTTHVKGDFVRNSAPSETGTAGSKYVVLGWLCVASGSPGTFVECRAVTDGPISFANQTQMEAASSTTLAVAPGTQQYHPSAAKGWIRLNGTGTIANDASYNVASIADNATGDYTVTWDTDFSSASYCVTLGCGGTGVVGIINSAAVAPTAGATRVTTFGTTFALVDATYVWVAAHGDQ